MISSYDLRNMANVIITRNFQVTIPKEIRQKLK
jgi:bifunctional DNA-binding transcriptional regulator/antitoxin component of YhaV-PrlF toxin-antitoxin module